MRVLQWRTILIWIFTCVRDARSLAAALALCSLVFAPRAAGQPLPPLSYDLTIDGAVIGAAAITGLTMELFQSDWAPRTCRWCVPGFAEGELSRSVAWRDAQVADTLSTLMTLTVPAALIGYGLLKTSQLGDPDAGWVDALLITEAASIALVVARALEYALGRARPYVWQGRSEPLDNNPADRNLSFSSGHTALAFATAVSAGTIFRMQNLPGAPVALGVGLAAAAVVGYLRMAANQHYLSDVLVGAAVGSLVGWVVPYLFHRPSEKAVAPGAIRAVSGGFLVAW